MNPFGFMLIESRRLIQPFSAAECSNLGAGSVRERNLAWLSRNRSPLKKRESRTRALPCFARIRSRLQCCSRLNSRHHRLLGVRSAQFVEPRRKRGLDVPQCKSNHFSPGDSIPERRSSGSGRMQQFNHFNRFRHRHTSTADGPIVRGRHGCSKEQRGVVRGAA